MHGKDNSQKSEPKRFGVKALVLTGALTLALSGAIGGTIAWLISEETVTNTFTYGDINITLTETDTDDGDDDPSTNTYDMVPGNSITKDPKVTVEADSEDCWLFVKLDESENFEDFMTYSIADGWTALENNEGVYYRIIDGSDTVQEFSVIANDTVTVLDTVTKEMLNALDADGAENYPTLTVTAYAVQRDAEIDAIDTVEEAWALTQE
ncbi:MAG: hypothetical protein E7497_04975 [Ruminococcus sp.]|nr:hypothetical protein [Ruminococcus sp.]